MDSVEIPISIGNAKTQGDAIKIQQAFHQIAAEAELAQKKTSSFSSTLDTLSTKARTIGTNIRSSIAQAGPGLSSALAPHVAELTRGLTGAQQSLANIAISAGPSFGPWGVALSAAAGAIGLITQAEREFNEKLEQTRRLDDVYAQLGASANSVRATISATATAQEQYNQALAAARAINQQRIAATNANVDAGTQSTFANAVRRSIEGIRGLNGAITANVQESDIMNAVLSRNTGQLAAWGINIRLGEDATKNLRMATLALMQVEVQRTRQLQESTQAASRAAQIGVQQAQEQLRRARNIGEVETAQENLRAAEDRLTSTTLAVADADRSAYAASSTLNRTTRELQEAQDRLTNSEAARAAGAKKHREGQSHGNSVSREEIALLRTRIALSLHDLVLLRGRTELVNKALSPTENLGRIEQARSEIESRGLLRTHAQRQRYLDLLTQEVTARQAIASQESAIRQRELEMFREREIAQNRLNDPSAMNEFLQAERTRYEQEFTNQTALIDRTLEYTNAINALNQARSGSSMNEVQQMENAQNELRIREQLVEAGRNNLSVMREQGIASAEAIVAQEQAVTSAVNRLTQAQTTINQLRANSNRAMSQFVSQMKTYGEQGISTFSNSLWDAIDAGESFAAVMQKNLKSLLLSMAKESTIKALMSVAEGIAAFAGGNIPSGIGFMKAAAAYGAVAAAAGGLSQAVPAGEEASATRSSIERPARMESPQSNREEEKGYVINITVNGALMNEGVEEGIVRSLDRAASRGLTPRFARLGRG